MSESFTLSRSRCVAADPSLREELRTRTGSDQAVSGILRSIDRFGGDDSIVGFEISKRSSGRPQRGAKSVAWGVRAVRS